MIDRISKAEDKTKVGIEMCAELIKSLKGICQESTSWLSAGEESADHPGCRQPIIYG